jgi:tetratricopeptide (TPR) repeat protein
VSDSRSLVERIPDLVDEVDASLRHQLRETQLCLHAPGIALQSFQKPLLRFCKLLYALVDATIPSDNPCDCIVQAGLGDKKKPGLNLLPPEMNSYLHSVRVISAKVRHDVEEIEVTALDVELGLSILIRVIRWLYCEFERGPKLAFDIFKPAPPESNAPARSVDLCRFPITRTFKGRDDDLRRLDEAWADPTVNVLVVHAWGGVGKSTLIGTWLGRLGKDAFKGAHVVYAYSFEGTAGDRFLESALRKFGDPDPTLGNPEERGQRLAELLQRQRNLLVLDGFQWLQEQEGDLGKIKSPAIQSLICTLAVQNKGLCVISTRLPVLDLAYLAETTAPVLELKNLSSQAGAELLKSLGVRGPDEELEQASTEVQGHALALNLLGTFLVNAWNGDVYQRDHLNLMEADDEQGGQAKRVLASYELFLASQRRPALAAIRLVSLFHRPARPEAIDALLAKPAIEGLTDNLMSLKSQDWHRIVKKLRDYKLLFPDTDGETTNVLDSHPLVREYFSATLRQERPKAYSEANRRLYRHFRGIKPELPETTEQMGSLYLAVIHGCHAGEYEDVLNWVYWPRIKREGQVFNTKVLGAFVADLTVLGAFFKSRWDEFHAEVPVIHRARLLYEVAFDLRALGRLEESLGPMRSCLAIQVGRREWRSAAATAGDLSLLYLTIGSLDKALRHARHGVAYGDRCECPFERVRARSNLVNALIQLGRIEEALRSFQEAEGIVTAYNASNRTPNGRPPTLQSYWFYELHLERKDYTKVKAMVLLAQAEATSTGMIHLDMALTETVLAQVCMSEHQASQDRESGPDPTLLNHAAVHLNRALAEIVMARTDHHRPRVLLARAALHRLCGDRDQARDDIDRAWAIAKRGTMELHKADLTLESARLSLACGDLTRAWEEYQRARDRIARIGYRRRASEVEDLAFRLESLGLATRTRNG